MNDLEMIRLLKRIDLMYRGKVRDADELALIADEWMKTLGYCSAERLNDALTIYNREGSRYSPRTQELLAIYNRIGKENERNAKKLQIEDADYCCSFCNLGISSNQKRFALVTAVEGDFWGVYPALGMSCPCTKAGEMAALKRGQHIHRKVGKKRGDDTQVYVGDIELWVDECGQLVGRATKGFRTAGSAEKHQEIRPQEPEAQSRLFSPEDWAVEMGSSELPF